jgi:hypothetical protein
VEFAGKSGEEGVELALILPLFILGILSLLGISLSKTLFSGIQV